MWEATVDWPVGLVWLEALEGEWAVEVPSRAPAAVGRGDADLELPLPSIVARHFAVQLIPQGVHVVALDGVVVFARRRVFDVTLWPGDTLTAGAVALRITPRFVQTKRP